LKHCGRHPRRQSRVDPSFVAGGAAADEQTEQDRQHRHAQAGSNFCLLRYGSVV